MTQTHAEAAVTIATEQGFPQHVAQVTPLRGWALAASQARGVTANRPYHLALLAEACAQAGQTTAGLAALAEALTALPRSRARWWEAELHRLRGALLLQHPPARPGEAEACFHQALSVSRRQQARSLELRAAMNLARLWQQQGKRAEARALLAPIYGWFTEGFDTADILEAKVVLDALS